MPVYAPAAVLVALPGAMAPQWIAMPPLPGDDLAAVLPAAMARLIAGQEADLARFAAAAETLATAPDRALNAALREVPRLGPGEASGVVMTAITTGQGSCSETVIYTDPGNGAAPQVAVRKTGNACPAGSRFARGMAPSVIPTARPQSPRLLEAAALPFGVLARQSRAGLTDRLIPSGPVPQTEPVSYLPVR